MRVANWHPEIYDQEIIGASMQRLKKAAEVVADKARSKVPVGNISRPIYKAGKYAGASWTKRVPGSLKKTIRVVEKPGVNNIWIMAGNRDIFYAKVVEAVVRKYLKPALNQSKSRIIEILRNG